jgi:glycosyltransferase involved in cell wall biosynthesis
MKIGVAIPCFCDHLPHLLQLLHSIERQTRLPDAVVVSCSSTIGSVETPQYRFPLVLIVTEEKKNAAQNRNIAMSFLLADKEIDYITFMDADDIMHPQRIEILLNMFDFAKCDIVLHNYLPESCSPEFERIEKVEMRINQLTQCESGCTRHVDFYRYQHEGIHHSQSSVTREVLFKVQYPEEQEFYRKEDSVFCNRVLGLGNIINVYVANPLSYYKMGWT